MVLLHTPACAPVHLYEFFLKYIILYFVHFIDHDIPSVLYMKFVAHVYTTTTTTTTSTSTSTLYYYTTGTVH